MTWMNEYEIAQAVEFHRRHPILGPATKLLQNLVEITNTNSDGWPYWSKPTRAANKLMELIEAAHPYKTPRREPTPAEFKKAVTPIKSFYSRHRTQLPNGQLNFPEI